MKRLMTNQKPSEKLLPPGVALSEPDKGKVKESQKEDKLLPSWFDTELAKALHATPDREILLPPWFNDCDDC